MATKANKIVLFDSSNNASREFEINHAERLLRMPNNGGWTLPENPTFKFDQQNGITIKPIAKQVKVAKGSSDNTESNQA